MMFLPGIIKRWSNLLDQVGDEKSSIGASLCILADCIYIEEKRQQHKRAILDKSTKNSWKSNFFEKGQCGL